MEIIRTFEGQIKGVFLARFVNCPFYSTNGAYETEFDQFQDQFQDPQFVRNFIKSEASGWKKGAYKNVTLNSLAADILKEAGDLLDKLADISKLAQKEDCFDVLFDNFKGLSINEKYNTPGRRKMYTYESGSFLRIYGILLGNDCLIITGASIKLVGKMKESDALQQELNKMDYVLNWLKENQITESMDF